MKSPHEILHQYWGFNSFRPRQEEIIQSVLNGNDTVALLPTGGGKSVCFQIPALINEGICIVISPLVALMTDQIKSLQAKGIKALAITGGKSYDEVSVLLDNAVFGAYKFLYVSPERLQQEMVQLRIREMNVSCIAVDEAHCISQWGNDFRPSYKKISILRELHPLAPIIALTATATPEVLEDTIKELELTLPVIVKDSFVRPNLAYNVVVEEDKLYRVEQLLKHNHKAGIVYVRSRKDAWEYSNQLNSLGIVSDFYHGGIPAEDKTKKLEAWKTGTVPIMVATNAFGMGIDLATVAHVIHVQLPESIESYFQEAGRAGRDGNYACATLLYNEYDKALVKNRFINSLATVSDLKLIYKKLNAHMQIPYGEGEYTNHAFSFIDFCSSYELRGNLVYNALNTLDRLGIIQLSKEFGRSSRIKFIVSNQVALDYFKHDVAASVIGKSILRMYGGVFEILTSVNLFSIKSKTNQSISNIINALERLKDAGIIELHINTTDASVTFLKPREDDKTINVIAREVEHHNEKKEQQVAQVIKYIGNETECRSVQLTRYFGDKTATSCGICTVCSADKSLVSKTELLMLSEKIINELETVPMTSRELTETLTFAETKIFMVLQLLLNAGKISIDVRNRYHLK
ncbi:MAG: ATP-dependent DNA helicase RecQ [Patiriisocius sp.]|jgi:ATP-dependent DNA helicase RecQ